jgi:PAS domain S-box-containing protein/putative nucleotidyltransferase with HDIG domain
MKNLSKNNRELIEENALLTRRITDSDQAQSDLKRAEEKLKEKEKFLVTMIQSSAVATFVINAEHKVVYWNKACEDLTGIKSEDLLGTSDHWKPFYDYPRPCVADLIIDNKFNEMTNLYEVYARSVLIPDGIRAEGWYPNLGGKNRYILFDAAPIRDDQGKLIAAIETLQDITKRKQAEQVIQEEKNLSASIINSLPGIFYLFDSQGKFLRWNRNFEIVSGFSHQEMLERHPSDFFAGTDKELVQQRIQNTFVNGEANVEARFVSRNGLGALYFLTGVRIEINGQPHLMGMGLDITERKKTEEAIVVAKNDWENTFDNVTDMITIHDEDFNIVRANPAARAIFGLQLQNGMPLAKCFSSYHGTENPPTDCPSCQCIQTGKPCTVEIFEPYLNRHLEIRAMPRFGSDGRAVGLIHVVRDITQRKKAEEQLQHSLDRLRVAFSATIQVMVTTVEARDPYTAGHQMRSADLARAIATEIGLPQDKIEGLRMAASIHDIGKISIPAEILSKPTKLSEIEFSLIKEHVNRGYEMLKNVKSPWPLAEIVHQHHEKMDGSGYPRNLKGEEICIEARVLAVADTVEAMASHRPYRAGLGIDAALSEIEKNRGICYDDAVANACLRLFREKGFKLEGT